MSEIEFEHPTYGHVAILGWDQQNEQWQAAFVDDDGNVYVTATSFPLPTGAATAANQTTMITALQLIDDLRNALDSVGTDELDVNIEDSIALDVQPHGYTGTAWKKLGMVWGYNDTVSELVENLNLDAGANTVSGTAVAEGEVWVVSTIAASVTSGVITSLSLQISVGGVVLLVRYEAPPVSGAWYVVTGNFILAEDDYVRIYIEGAAAGDDGRLRYGGYKMKVDM